MYCIKYIISLGRWFVVVVVVIAGFYDTFLTSQVISVALDIECEKYNKFCSEALISA